MSHICIMYVIDRSEVSVTEQEKNWDCSVTDLRERREKLVDWDLITED